MKQRFVTIARYRDFPPAGLSQSILESEGIPCFLNDQHMVGVNWLYSNALGGIRLKVAAKDAEAARKILAAYASAASTEDPQQPEPDHLPVSTCPVCGKTDIGAINYQRKSAAIALLLSLPLFIFAKRYRCRDCGYKWK